MSDESPNSEKKSDRRTLKRIGKWLLILLGVVLILILLLGLIPVPTKDLVSNPDPTSSYDEAIAQFEAVLEEEAPIVNEASDSQLMTHGETTDKAFVLIHGITNSPKQWEELGSHLHQQGHNVLILRMPYHGLESHNISELKALRAEDLRAYADSAIDMANGLGDEITVIGISGGGDVATWIAQHRPDAERVLALSPFYGLPGVPAFLDTFLMNLFSRVPNVSLQNPSEPQREWVYRGEATRGVAEFMILGKEIFQAAENKTPAAEGIYFVTTAVDNTASNHLTQELVDLWTEDGANISSYEFDDTFDIPHNSVDPAADPLKKGLVYGKILEMLDEEPMQ